MIYKIDGDYYQTNVKKTAGPSLSRGGKNSTIARDDLSQSSIRRIR